MAERLSEPKSSNACAGEAVVINVSVADQTLDPPCRAIWVGGVGAVKVDMETTGTGIVFTAVPAGTLLPIRAKKVYNSGTTATLMVALY